MFRNYLKIAWRNLQRNKVHAFINLSGLALGLACTLLILMWIRRELSVDQYHANIDHLYRILENQSYSGRDIFTVSSTPGVMMPKLKETYPEVRYGTRLTWGDRRLFKVGAKALNERGFHADPDFFQMFTHPFLAGDPETALDEPKTVVISRSLAEKYFGRTQVVGESITVDDTLNARITGVFEDVPDASTLQFDFIMPFEDYFQRSLNWINSWNSNNTRGYIQFMPGVDAAAFAEKFRTFVADNSDQDNVEMILQAYKDTYLRTDFKNGKYQGGGRIASVRLFALIAGFILLIACINFMNLTTAYSANRGREVGIRRVSGATRQKLVVQFLTECTLLTFIAGAFALLVVRLALPWFNELFDVELRLDLLDWPMLVGLVALLLLTGLLAGSYPAFFLSRFEPVRVLKGIVSRGSGAVWFRKGMVVTQFAIATFLILSTLVIYRQMEYLRHKNLGYQKENLLTVRMMGQMNDRYDIIKENLLRVQGVEAVSSTNGYIYSWGNNTSGVSWPGKDPAEEILFQTVYVDYDFVETIGAELVAGRDFSRSFPADSTNFVINEKAAKLMGLDDPVGQPLSLGESEGVVVGLVRDFNVTSLYNEQDPVIMALAPYRFFLYLRIRPENVQQTIGDIEKVIKTHNPAYPVEYAFVDQEYDQLYRSEARTSALSRVFAFLSVFVSCLGLFGLAAFATRQRTKEIGIRKVLGASVMQISSLLNLEFLALVLAGFLIGVPTAWWLTSRWLSDFAYRVDLEWWLAPVVAVLAILVALVTVSFQTVRAALRNPVKALKYE